MLASRTTPTAPAARSPSAPVPGPNPDAGTKAEDRSATDPPDCSAVQAFLGVNRLSIRTYDPPPAKPTIASDRVRAPYVAAVARCGPRIILQVQSRSPGAWSVRQAHLESPGGELLEIEALHSGKLNQWSVNVIVAKLPEGASITKLRLDMTGTDGRVAQAEVGDLP